MLKDYVKAIRRKFVSEKYITGEVGPYHVTYYYKKRSNCIHIIDAENEPQIERFEVDIHDREIGIGRLLVFTVLKELEARNLNIDYLYVHPAATDIEHVPQETVEEIYKKLQAEVDKSDFSIKIKII